MVRCFICNNENANNPVLENHVNMAKLHRKRFGFVERHVEAGTRVCVNCYNRIRKIAELENDDFAPILEVIVSSVTRKCFICRRVCNNRTTIKTRADFYIKTNIFLPPNTRCCSRHLTDLGLVKMQLIENVISVPMKVKMTGEELTEWMRNLRELALEGVNNKFQDESNFEDEDFKSLTSVNKQQFNELYGCCVPVNIYGRQRKVLKKHLITFLIKMRQGLSDEFLKSVLNFPSRQSVSLVIETVRQSLMARFVPQNLGLNSPELQNKNQFIQNHVTEFANLLYNSEPEI